MQKYERHSIVGLDTVLDLISDHLSEGVFVNGRFRSPKVTINGELVKIGTLRLRTFAIHGITCSACGLVGKFFALERNVNQGSYHLNLYGHNELGEEVLFTHDHTVSRSQGGADTIDNVTTMCGPCNWKKGVGSLPGATYVQKEG
jgi:hypothetical protein